MGDIFGREPVLVLGFLRAIVVLAVSFGLNLTQDQLVALYLVLELTVSLIARQRVTPVENIVSGDRVIRTSSIGGSGDRATYRWIIRADAGSDITIEINNPHLGDQKVTVRAE